MKIHTLTNVKGARSRKLRVGRGVGSGKGKTSGRGHKGQMACKGHKHKLGFEGGQMRLIRRLPKVGFKNPARREYATVNVAALATLADGAEVTVETLRETGILKVRGMAVKLLGKGDIDKKLVVKLHAFSESAKAKIIGAGGACETVKI